jgi:biopolymer transport protein ExbD
MAFNNSGFDQNDFQAPMAEINTTPLVDVMLVLLVIFLVTAPMITHNIKLELPNETAQVVEEKQAIQISIDSKGILFWDETTISIDDLENRLISAAKKDPEQTIHVNADKNSNYGHISHVLATIQRSGLKNIGFLTTP